MGNIIDFEGMKYLSTDGSAIDFKEDGSFVWYQSDENHEDNFFEGVYQIFFDKDAADYVVHKLPQFNVKEEELLKFFLRNRGNDLYNIKNFCCLIIENQKLTMEGVDKQIEPYNTYYMGFYKDGYLEAANMQSGNYVKFNRV